MIVPPPDPDVGIDIDVTSSFIMTAKEGRYEQRETI